MNLYHARPAHHVDRLGDLLALLVPDLLRLPALRLHCLEGERDEREKGRTSFRSHGVALAEQYVKALEGGLKKKILLTWNGTFLMICGNKEGGLRKKAHMEWHFL